MQDFIPVSGSTTVITATMTRPGNTTPYTSGDLVANDVDAGDVAPVALPVSRVLGSAVIIPRIGLKKSTTGTTGAQFRVHLFKTAPTVTNGDNGAFLSTESGYIGYVDIVMDRVFSDGAKGFGMPAVGNQFIVEPDAGTVNIYALIEARGGYTPGSAEVFTLSADCLRD